MPEVNKEHLQLAAVIAAGVIQAKHQQNHPNQDSLVQALHQSYEAVQEAVARIEAGKKPK